MRAWCVVEIDRISDDRGFFARVWCQDEFAQQGLEPDWVQDNVGRSIRAGTLRGMHYQEEPHAEAKLVRCTRGEVYDVALDLRPSSPSYLKWVGVTLGADDHTMLYIPEGCAHGYQTLADDSEIVYSDHRQVRSGRRHRCALRRPGIRDRVAAPGRGDLRTGCRLGPVAAIEHRPGPSTSEVR